MSRSRTPAMGTTTNAMMLGALCNKKKWPPNTRNDAQVVGRAAGNAKAFRRQLISVEGLLQDRHARLPRENGMLRKGRTGQRTDEINWPRRGATDTTEGKTVRLQFA